MTSAAIPPFGRMTDMTVTELKERIDRGDAPMIVDVREPAEFEICRIPGAVLIPLPQLPSRLGELDPAQELVLHCKVGGRSAQRHGVSPARGVCPRPQPDRRHPRLDRPG